MLQERDFNFDVRKSKARPDYRTGSVGVYRNLANNAGNNNVVGYFALLHSVYIIGIFGKAFYESEN